MDRLRAMEYLVRVVEAGGFAAAARDLDVSPSAVTQLIAALERELGAQLLRRDSRHLSLTPDGEHFLPACTNALAELRAAEARLSVNRTRASGKLVVGMQRRTGQAVAPFIADFLAAHPGISLDLRVVPNPKVVSAALVDVLIFVGWLEDTDMIAKRIAQTRYVTCSSPAYWQARGVPRDPDDLRGHTCLTFRSPWGAVLDLWKYQRGGEVRNVPVEARIVSEDLDWAATLGAHGGGVLRVVDLHTRSYFEQGLLQPVLQDWEALEAPPVHVMYRRGARTSARVRAFVNFVTELFPTFEASRPIERNVAPVPMPSWFRQNWAGSLTRRVRPRADSADRSSKRTR
jgi:LysR family transcriptional regulator, regulator for bpeEF and oprC